MIYWGFIFLCIIILCGLVTPCANVLTQLHNRSRSQSAKIMSCCPEAPSHYLNQCWLTIKKVHNHSSEVNFTWDTSTINHLLENYLPKIPFKSPRGQWVKEMALEGCCFDYSYFEPAWEFLTSGYLQLESTPKMLFQVFLLWSSLVPVWRTTRGQNGFVIST